ncbi:hypothetical protein MIR68_011179 [Amoeboaphelidium protococcarum]|nr:hypothetical protein MIR68_011179 [Amoeboaphelidium protococcarum]
MDFKRFVQKALDNVESRLDKVLDIKAIPAADGNALLGNTLQSQSIQQQQQQKQQQQSLMDFDGFAQFVPSAQSQSSQIVADIRDDNVNSEPASDSLDKSLPQEQPLSLDRDATQATESAHQDVPSLNTDKSDIEQNAVDENVESAQDERVDTEVGYSQELPECEQIDPIQVQTKENMESKQQELYDNIERLKRIVAERESQLESAQLQIAQLRSAQADDDQVEALKREAEKISTLNAKLTTAYKKLREKDVQSTAQIEKLSKQVEDQKVQVSSLQNQISLLEQSKLDYTRNVVDLEANVKDLEQKYQSAEALLKDVNYQLQDSKDQIKNLQEEIDSLNQQSATAGDSALKEKSEEYEAIIKDLNSQVSQYRQELKQIQSRSQKQIESLQQNIMSLQQENGVREDAFQVEADSLMNRLAISQSEAEDLRAELQSLEGPRVIEVENVRLEHQRQQNELRDVISKLEKEVERLADQLSQSSEQYTELQQRFDTLQQQYDECKQDLQKSREVIQSNDETILQLKSELKLLADENIELKQEIESSTANFTSQIEILKEQVENLQNNQFSKQERRKSSLVAGGSTEFEDFQNPGIDRESGELDHSTQLQQQQSQAFKNLEQQYNLALELVGEKTERIEELQADIEDMKVAYRTQLNDLIDQLQELKSLNQNQ